MDNDQSKPVESDTEPGDSDNSTHPNYDRSYRQYGLTKLSVNVEQIKIPKCIQDPLTYSPLIKDP